MSGLLKLCILVVAMCMPSVIWGCTCGGPRPNFFKAYCSANRGGSDSIFLLGSINSKSERTRSNYREPIVYTVDIHEWFGGVLSENAKVSRQIKLLGIADSFCGIGDHLSKGSTYLFGAYETGPDTYGFNICADYERHNPKLELGLLRLMKTMSTPSALCG